MASKPQTANTHGGTRPNSGRKAEIAPGEESVIYSIRLSPRQREGVDLIGGPDVIREFIDRALARRKGKVKP